MHEEIEFGGGLIDLSGLDLRDVGMLDDSPLNEELSELLADADKVAYAGFDSSI